MPSDDSSTGLWRVFWNGIRRSICFRGRTKRISGISHVLHSLTPLMYIEWHQRVESVSISARVEASLVYRLRS